MAAHWGVPSKPFPHDIKASAIIIIIIIFAVNCFVTSRGKSWILQVNAFPAHSQSLFCNSWCWDLLGCTVISHWLVSVYLETPSPLKVGKVSFMVPVVIPTAW